MTRLEKLKFSLFLSFFGLTGFHLISQFGVIKGLHITLLTWSFFLLCLPFSGRPIITSTIFYFFSKNSLYPNRFDTFVRPTRWFFAVVLNICTYIATPYTYLSSATTFLLYRILSNPWPYWTIILVSSFGSFYDKIVGTNRHLAVQPKHIFVKIALAIFAIAIFFYLSYLEIVVFLFSKTFN